MDFLPRWHEHFTANTLSSQETSQDVFKGNQPGLTDQEKRCIEKSIAAFQLGEYSEGRGLLKSAERFARKIENESLVNITKLFIAEEQNHANLLRRFMLLHDLKLLKRHWADVVFRQLRKGAGFELSITVLITAEIIALVYYKALRASTGSAWLKKICTRILADEVNHVRYESELINHIRGGKPAVVRGITKFLHLVLFTGTVIVVYVSHKRVLNKGGYPLTSFWVACWEEFLSCFHPKGFARTLLEASSRK